MEGETNRLITLELELQALLNSVPAPAPAPDEFLSDTVGSLHHLQMNVTSANMNIEQSAGQFETNYREKLRSYSSFPASSPAATSSDTTSQCTGAEMSMDNMCEQSFSDGDGDHRRRFRPQVRQRRGSLFKGKSQADPEILENMSPSQRSYECDVCARKFPSPQSLGGHKNLHKNKGKLNSASRRRFRAAPADQMAGPGSGSNSRESESMPSPYRGVRCREGDKWVSEIRPPKSTAKWWLGTFPSAEEAAQAYDVALSFFKSESELNFGHHALYRKLPPISLDGSPHKYAQSLRVMVKEISDQIIAERRGETRSSPSPSPSLEEQAAPSSQYGRPTVSTDSSSTAPATLDLPIKPDFVTPPSPDLPFDPLSFLNIADLS